MRFFWLYRPTVPTPRAQAIQVVHMAHAMASRGHEVRLCVERDGASRDPAAILDYYGLCPIAGLDLRVLPASRTLASLAFRAWFTDFIFRGSDDSIVYARSKRYALEARRRIGRAFRLVLEAHEVDSVLAAERGEDPLRMQAFERVVLERTDAVVTNCPGTLALLRQTHPDLPPALAAHNGTHASRARSPDDAGEGAAFVGSLLDSKDVRTLAEAARQCRTRITVIGARPEEAITFGRLSGGKLRIEPPIPHRDVPDRLARFRTLVLPLSRGVFGEHLASPLKLWDYQAVHRPIVAADLPTVHDAAPGAFLPYLPGDPGSLADAIDRVDGDASLRATLIARARLRTWADRAAEIETFLTETR